MNKQERKRELMLRTYYKKNKSVLMSAGYTYEMFEANIAVLRKTNHVYTKGAIKIFEHKTDFVSKERIAAENIVSSMKDWKYTEGGSRYADFRKEVVGWKNKLDYSSFEYTNGKYIYHGALQDVEFELITGSAGSQYWNWRTI